VYAGLTDNMPRLDYTDATCPSLLLEPSRTNIVTQSEYFGDWSNTEVNLDFGYLAPDGTNSAYKVTATGTTTNSSLYKGFGLDNTYTRSIWAKTTGGTGLVSLLSYKNNTNNVFTITNEWQRFSVSNVPEPTGLGNFYAVDFRAATTTLSEVLIWGAQCEQGSYPTSYIPTYGSSVTRSKDLAISPSDTFDSLSTFTWFFEISRLGFSSDSTSAALTLRTSSGAEQIRCHFDSPSEHIRFRDAINGYTTIGNSISAPADTYLKLCVVSDGVTIKAFSNGSQSGGAYTIVTQHDVDRTYMDGKGFDCKQMAFFPTALTDSECIALTTI